MKWRQSIIYLVVLVLVGGYFYYFEVVKKGEKEARRKKPGRFSTFRQTMCAGSRSLPATNRP